MIHQHVAARVYGETRERLRVRECPECRHKQGVPAEKSGEALPCEKCGTELPPSGQAAGESEAPSSSTSGPAVARSTSDDAGK